jgi:hypothetical protein
MTSKGTLTAKAILLVAAVGALILAAATGGFSWPPPQAADGQASAVPDLAVILAKAAEYCHKLESVAFDYICREEITEKIDPNLDASPPPLPGWITGGTMWRRMPDFKNSYVYDYQCVRTGGKAREARTLIEKDRKKMNVPDAVLKTEVFTFGNAIQGPVGLFGGRVQDLYEYKIAGQDKIGGRPVVLVDSAPRDPESAAKNLYGKAWIDPATFDILKIEWTEKRVGNYDIFQKRADKFKRKPRLTLRSEFSVEKNGIRFPSRLYLEEAYLNERGRAFVRSETTVTYKDFKFFMVEVEIK